MTAPTQNPVHMQVALQEANTQMQIMLQRAQQLAIELYEERQLTAALRQALEAKSVGTDFKLEST
jgi:hypothetical protein